MNDELRQFFGAEKLYRKDDIIPNTNGCTIGIAVLKQLSFPPTIMEDGAIICPSCKSILMGDTYCGKCGQRIKWKYDDAEVII